jgi:tetratricopeptide (TPR) repeat protein/transcriptional regulator with XRE-family HTH domain
VPIESEVIPSPFTEELNRLLRLRGYSWRKLATLAGYHPSWLSKIKHGAAPSPDLVRRCDEVLEAGGLLIALAATGDHRRPAQLPAPPAVFVGREPEIQQALRALSDPRDTEQANIVVIDGPPGSGKTTFALRCAHAIKMSFPGLYPDGELYADMHGYSAHAERALPEDVLEEFLVALGVPPREVPPGLASRAKLYRSLLASRRALILLDNAASSAQLMDLIPAAPGCSVIVTSRRKLVGLSMRIGCKRIGLGPMTGADSVSVLREAIADPLAPSETGELPALAGFCDHLPLALRIAAGRVLAHPGRPISELVAELRAEQYRLDGLVTDDTLAVKTVFEWSYRDLDAPEAELFRRLGLLKGPHVSVHAAAALSGVPLVRARRGLEKLATVHLLESAAGDSYHLHDLLRLYARDRAEDEDSWRDRQAAVSRLATWYAQTTAAAARAISPFRHRAPAQPCGDTESLSFIGAEDALRWCDAEAANFVPVIEAAVGYQLFEVAWTQAVALTDYLRLVRKPLRLWLSAAELGLRAAQESRDRRAQGWAEMSLAEAYRRARQHDRSQRLFRHALDLGRQTGDRHGEAWALAGMACLAIDQGDPDEAGSHAQQALAIFSELGDLDGEASSLCALAGSCRGKQHDTEALGYLQRSLLICEKIEDHDGEAVACAMIAEEHLRADRHDLAVSYFERSVTARRLAGSAGGEADSLVRLSRALTAMGNPRGARCVLAAALAIYEEVDPAMAGDLLSYLNGEAEFVSVLSRLHG